MSILAHVQRTYRSPNENMRSLASCRGKRSAKKHAVPGQAGYTLPAVPPEQIISLESCGVEGLYRQMAEMGVGFAPTPYGNAHGLLLRYNVNPFGDDPMT